MWVDEAKTLWLDRNRDTWQLPLLCIDGVYCGNIVAQIVDPRQCLVRYFVVFSHLQTRKFLIPSETVTQIDTAVHCACGQNCLQKLPDYVQKLTVEFEQQIQEILEDIL